MLRDWLGEAKAKQVYLILRDRILTGAIASGAKLPMENELAEVTGVSRVTIYRALGELARDRLIERRRSASTRVIYRPVLAPLVADISGMLASLDDTDRRTAVKLTSFAYVASRPLFDLMERAIDHLHALYWPDRYAFEIGPRLLGHAG